MNLVLTPEMLEAAYEFLRTMPPFNRWKLPHVEEVDLSISRSPKWVGCFWANAPSELCIDISERFVGHIDTLLKTMAHEMIHLVQYLQNETNSSTHNAAFRKRAQQVCKHHGWDLKVFV